MFELTEDEKKKVLERIEFMTGVKDIGVKLTEEIRQKVESSFLAVKESERNNRKTLLTEDEIKQQLSELDDEESKIEFIVDELMSGYDVLDRAFGDPVEAAAGYIRDELEGLSDEELEEVALEYAVKKEERK